jgi:hypothetical protein
LSKTKQGACDHPLTEKYSKLIKLETVAISWEHLSRQITEAVIWENKSG